MMACNGISRVRYSTYVRTNWAKNYLLVCVNDNYYDCDDDNDDQTDTSRDGDDVDDENDDDDDDDDENDAGKPPVSLLQRKYST